MKLHIQSLACLLTIIFMAATIYANENPAQNVKKHCRVELDTYCKDITPGKGRVLACLHAYSDKLSDQCKDAVRDSAELMRLISAASKHIKEECGQDLDNFCKAIEAGEGRLINCLKDHDNDLSQRCRLALKDVGFID